MRTEISAIGKMATIARLFEGSGFVCERPLVFNEKGKTISALKVMLEGMDFDLVYMPLKHLGYKAALNALGEIYAKFARPAGLAVNLGVSSRFSYEDIALIWQGFLAAAKEHSVSHLSVDLNPSINGLAISVSATGVLEDSLSEKTPAYKNMDLICLTGDLGAAYMGFHVLQREKVAFEGNGSKQPDLTPYKHLVGSYISPDIKPDMIRRFIDDDIYPSGGFFLTRGLSASIIDLTRESGFGAKIYIGKIPISSQTFAMSDELDIDAVTAAMNGGDDYKFIFTIPIGKHDMLRKNFQDYDIIGHLAQPDVGAVLVTPEGAELPMKAQGYQENQDQADAGQLSDVN